MSHVELMRLALRLARRGYGVTSPNPMVGAVLVQGGKIIGRGWHQRAGAPHAEIEALRDAQRRGHDARAATLYVTLEPCCTRGRTPPCTAALIDAGLKRVVVGAIDPNPKHSGEGLKLLEHAGIEVMRLNAWGDPDRPAEAARLGKLAAACARLNEAFNHWVVHRTPFVIVKAAMTLDGKIATARGESKWVTGQTARAYAMKLRWGADAILVGINTILADDPSLTARSGKPTAGRLENPKPLQRIVLDARARTPLRAQVVSDAQAAVTTIVVSESAPAKRIAALAKRVKVLVAPTQKPSPGLHAPQIDLEWLLRRLGAEGVTSLLVEGGGEVNASFLLEGRAQRVAFFYAPKILGGRNARKAVAGLGVEGLAAALQLRELEWRRLGEDLFLTARVE